MRARDAPACAAAAAVGGAPLHALRAQLVHLMRLLRGHGILVIGGAGCGDLSSEVHRGFPELRLQRLQLLLLCHSRSF